MIISTALADGLIKELTADKDDGIDTSSSRLSVLLTFAYAIITLIQ